MEPSPGGSVPPSAVVSQEIAHTTGPGLKDSDAAEGKTDADRFTSSCELLEFTYSSGAQGEYSDTTCVALPGDMVDAYGALGYDAQFDPRAPAGLAPQPHEVVVLRGDRNALTSARCATNPGFVREVKWGEPYSLVVVVHSTSPEMAPSERAVLDGLGPVPRSAEVTGADCSTSGLEQALGYNPASLAAYQFSDEAKAKAWASKFPGATVVQVTDSCGG